MSFTCMQTEIETSSVFNFNSYLDIQLLLITKAPFTNKVDLLKITVGLSRKAVN